MSLNSLGQRLSLLTLYRRAMAILLGISLVMNSFCLAAESPTQSRKNGTTLFTSEALAFTGASRNCGLRNGFNYHAAIGVIIILGGIIWDIRHHHEWASPILFASVWKQKFSRRSSADVRWGPFGLTQKQIEDIIVVATDRNLPLLSQVSIRNYLKGDTPLWYAAKELSRYFSVENPAYAEDFARIYLATLGAAEKVDGGRFMREPMQRYLRADLLNDKSEKKRLRSPYNTERWTPLHARALSELKDSRFEANEHLLTAFVYPNVSLPIFIKKHLFPDLRKIQLRTIGELSALRDQDLVAHGLVRTDINALRYALAVGYGSHLQGDSFYEASPNNLFSRDLNIPDTVFFINDPQSLMLNHFRFRTQESINSQFGPSHATLLLAALSNIGVPLAKSLTAAEIQSTPFSQIGIDQLNLSGRTKNALFSAFIFTLEDLLDCTCSELLRINHFGPISLDEVKLFLRVHNLPSLAADPGSQHLRIMRVPFSVAHEIPSAKDKLQSQPLLGSAAVGDSIEEKHGPINKLFARRLKGLRMGLKENPSQTTFGRHFGISLMHVSNLETARKRITTDLARQFAEFFGISPDYFLDKKATIQKLPSMHAVHSAT